MDSHRLRVEVGEGEGSAEDVAGEEFSTEVGVGLLGKFVGPAEELTECRVVTTGRKHIATGEPHIATINEVSRLHVQHMTWYPVSRHVIEWGGEERIIEEKMGKKEYGKEEVVKEREEPVEIHFPSGLYDKSELILS